MDQDQYNKIKMFVMKSLIPSLRHEAEDCTQYIAMCVFEKPKRSYRHALLDWLRENGHSYSRPKQGNVALGFARLKDEFKEWQEPRSLKDEVFELEDVERVINSVIGRDREVLIMRSQGKTLKEIAGRYGVCEARACHYLSIAIQQVRVFMNSETLSKSEQAVFDQLKKGLSNKEIADKLFVCEKTVKYHLTSIYRKLGAKTRSELIARYASAGPTQTIENEEIEMTNWEPMNKLPPGSVSVVPPTKSVSVSQQDNVNFVVNTFKINDTIQELQTMSKEVTKGDYSVDKVMAACQCIGRMNETIQTVMKAAQVLNGR